MPLAVAAVALTAGLAVATFVKAFGIGFLARPRSPEAARATESPASMLAGMGIAAAAPASALVAAAHAGAAGRSARWPAAVVGAGDPVAVRGLTIDLVGVAGSLSPLLLALALIVGVVVALAGVRALATRRAAREARLWDCGAGPMSARMEYTATSFAEPLQRVFDDVLRRRAGRRRHPPRGIALPGADASSTGGGCPTGSRAACTHRFSLRWRAGAGPVGGSRPAACTATWATASAPSARGC